MENSGAMLFDSLPNNMKDIWKIYPYKPLKTS